MMQMIIDSSVFHSDSVTVHLEDNICEQYSKIRMKHVFLRHENEIRRLFRALKPIYVHCSLLNMNDNFLNGRKSDVIAVLYNDNVKPRQKALAFNLANNRFRLLKPNNKITLSLTTNDGLPLTDRGRFAVVYEMEFLK